jgi:hypothetical protein
VTSSSTENREIRKFGLIAFIFFGSLCMLGIWLGKWMAVSLFGFLALLGLGFILTPGILKPVYLAWLKTTHFIGKALTIVVMTLAYYLVITPAALLKRLFGGRPLPLLPDKDASSYWIARAEPAQPKERFIKRY